MVYMQPLAESMQMHDPLCQNSLYSCTHNLMMLAMPLPNTGAVASKALSTILLIIWCPHLSQFMWGERMGGLTTPK